MVGVPLTMDPGLSAASPDDAARDRESADAATVELNQPSGVDSLPRSHENQTDADLLVVFNDGATTCPVLIEARMETGWTNLRLPAGPSSQSTSRRACPPRYLRSGPR